MLQVVEKVGEPEIQADFESFWALYPRKVAKKAARAAWERIGVGLHPTIINSLAGWAKVWRDKDPHYIPHAATWLHGERWEDELPREFKATAQAHQPFVAQPDTYKREQLRPDVIAKLRQALCQTS